MDEEAKRVYEQLPEAIEIEAAYMSCTEAVQSCISVINRLSDPVSPQSERIPTLEKPKPYNGKSFDKIMPRIVLVCYVANIIALFLLAWLSDTGDMGYRILICAMSPLVACHCCAFVIPRRLRWTYRFRYKSANSRNYPYQYEHLYWP